MANPKRALLGILGGLALALVPGADGPAALAGNPCYHGFEQETLRVESSTGVKALPCAFDPGVAVVPVGATVTFGSSPDGPAHLITGANQAWGERDVELQPDTTVAYTFDKPGVYPYACALHPGMSGAIVVGDGGEELAAAIAATSAAGGTTAAGDGTGGAGTAVGEAPAPASATGGITDSAALLVAALGGALLTGGAVFLATRRTRPRDISTTLADASETRPATR